MCQLVLFVLYTCLSVQKVGEGGGGGGKETSMFFLNNLLIFIILVMVSD
jgi:hypothetical protein